MGQNVGRLVPRVACDGLVGCGSAEHLSLIAAGTSVAENDSSVGVGDALDAGGPDEDVLLQRVTPCAEHAVVPPSRESACRPRV